MVSVYVPLQQFDREQNSAADCITQEIHPIERRAEHSAKNGVGNLQFADKVQFLQHLDTGCKEKDIER